MATSQPQWLLYAISSGVCASLNGVFAKMTTTTEFEKWSYFFGMKEESLIVEALVRGFFFGMNLLFNAIMWGLFTRALTLANSTVRVSVINTSANFMLTAVLGWIIFHESLPGLWWLGASFLVAGSVIIGRREESKDAGETGTSDAGPARAQDYSDEPDAPLGSRSGQALGGDLELTEGERRRSRSADRFGRGEED
ncbi:hypothetical protein Q7P35_011039 [Cladosporium inversicolor]